MALVYGVTRLVNVFHHVPLLLSVRPVPRLLPSSHEKAAPRRRDGWSTMSTPTGREAVADARDPPPPPRPDDLNAVNSNGDTRLIRLIIAGRIKAIRRLLTHPAVDPNKRDPNGFSPLAVATFNGDNQIVAILLGNNRVDPNQLDRHGHTVSWLAARYGQTECLKLFIADARVDLCHVGPDNLSIINAATGPFGESMGRIAETGGANPALGLVLLLDSRRIPRDMIVTSEIVIRRAQHRRRVAAAGSEIVLSVLKAARMGEFRWCSYCHKLTPDEDLDRCGGCKIVGYCRMPNETDEYVLKHMHHPRRKAWLGRVPCHVAHWKAGHKAECKRLSADADTAAATKVEGGAKGCPGVTNENVDECL